MSFSRTPDLVTASLAPSYLDPSPFDSDSPQAQLVPFWCSSISEVRVLQTLGQLEHYYSEYIWTVQSLLEEACSVPHLYHLVPLYQSKISTAQTLHHIHALYHHPHSHPYTEEGLLTPLAEEAPFMHPVFTEEEMDKLEAIPGIFELAREMEILPECDIWDDGIISSTLR